MNEVCPPADCGRLLLTSDAPGSYPCNPVAKRPFRYAADRFEKMLVSATNPPPDGSIVALQPQRPCGESATAIALTLPEPDCGCCRRSVKDPTEPNFPSGQQECSSHR